MFFEKKEREQLVIFFLNKDKCLYGRLHPTPDKMNRGRRENGAAF